MSLWFGQVTIIGVGLLGASLGLALKKRSLAGRVVGVGQRAASLDIALQRGAVDVITTDVAEGVCDAQLIVIATPARLVPPMLDLVLRHAPPDTCVTDVASTKAVVCAHAEKVCPKPRRFVGAHPMAGGDQFGPEHGRADFYEKATCLLEQGGSVDIAVREQIRALWTAVGSQVFDVTPEDHDAMLARTSHAPHVLAAILARAADDFGAKSAFIGNGFRDVTRIAASRPEIWRDISLDNRSALLECLAHIRADIEGVEALLEREDSVGLEAFFEAGSLSRRRVMES